MEICVESFDGEKYTVDVGVDDTTADIRRKVASAAELREDGFDMSFGGKVMDEGYDMTQLSSGDTIFLTKSTMSKKDAAIAALRALGETELTAGMLQLDQFQRTIDLKLVYLFLQAELLTELPAPFFSCRPFEELDLSDVLGVTTIRNNFLGGCSSLHTIDLSGWSNVTHIEYAFFFRCGALRTIDLSGWHSVKHIGDCFFYSCTSLTTLDLSACSSVTHIRKYFLANCTALRTVDFSGWHSVKHIGDCFFDGCISLTALDLSGWSNVTHVGRELFQGCSSLATLNLSGWNKVAQIGDCFLSNCSALRTLDWSGWASVTHIGRGGLNECNLDECSINVTGSSSVVSEYARTGRMQWQCVCM